MSGCDSLDVFHYMTSGVTYYYILLIRFFSGSEKDTASSDSISHPIVFFTVLCCLCLFFRNSCFTLASQCSCSVMSRIAQSWLNSWCHGKAADGFALWRVVSDEPLNFENKWCKVSDESLQNFRLSVCMWIVFLWCKTCLFKADEVFFCCCYG